MSEPIPLVPPLVASKLSQLDFTDLVFSNEACNLVSKNRAQVTHLESIGGVEIRDITINKLRKFCVNNGFRGSRTLCKLEIVNRLYFKIKDPEAYLEAYGADEAPVAVKTEVLYTVTSRFNRRRFVNILFSEPVRALLADRGRPLTAAELTLGLKTDQKIHQVICREYNKKEIYLYNQNVFEESDDESTLDNRYLEVK